MHTELITIKQLPVIEQQLNRIKGEITQKINSVAELECNEDTYKQIKTLRADINKDFEELEARRIAVKKEILAPYEQFEVIYKECVKEPFTDGIKRISERICGVENGLKQQKRDAAIEYFNEYISTKGIDFLTFDDIGINITMSASAKSIRDNIKSKVDRISDDLEMIDTQEHKEEILVEYKKSLNAAQSVSTVKNRHADIEAERIKSEQKTRVSEYESAKEDKVDQAVREFHAPVEASGNMKYKMSFTVFAENIEILKDLKKYMDEKEGLRYEQ